MTDEQGDQQRRSTMVQVRRPNHRVPARDLQDSGDEVQEGWLVVGDSLGEQTISVAVDNKAVMMGLAGINAGPKLHQEQPPVCRFE